MTYFEDPEDKPLTKPTVNEIDYMGKLGCFHVEKIDLTFSNGENRIYYRLAARHDAVHLLIIDGDDLIFVEEYGGGVLDYGIGLVRGGVDPDESALESAERELSEEVGLKARKFTQLRSYYGNTGYQTGIRCFVVAEDVYPDPNPLEGDEPEPLKIIRWPIARLDELFTHPKFVDSSNIIGLYQLRDYLAATGRYKYPEHPAAPHVCMDNPLDITNGHY